MPNPTSLLVATALVAIPSTAGIYHLATSSSSSKTVEQEEPNKEDQAQELDSAKGLDRPEIETRQDIDEQPLDIELPEDTSLISVSTQNKVSTRQVTDIAEAVKRALSDLSIQFPYDNINLETGSRTNQFDSFVIANDSIWTSLGPLLKEFVNKEDYKNTDIKTLARGVLSFDLIDTTSNDVLWSRLVQIRKDEAGAQTDIDSSGVSRLGFAPEGSDVTKNNIMDFCLNPSEANSHLGMYSAKRKEQEETREYRLFTYYSYCTKGSHYLSDNLKFDPVSE